MQALVIAACFLAGYVTLMIVGNIIVGLFQ